MTEKEVSSRVKETTQNPSPLSTMSEECLITPKRFHELVHDFVPPVALSQERQLELYAQFHKLNLETIFFYVEIARSNPLNDFLSLVISRVYTPAFQRLREEAELLELLPLYFVYRQNGNSLAPLIRALHARASES
ncbi:MAG: hypothetical protein RL150_635 [Candidatus Parcubacteria bacterium]